ncbi:DUF4191 domain-containing protein [Natronosporangium hydrolyticum]|uniref:DUF4191 domain-containing protein n=1 Tax=Natronosporangium hydrolyticum TaxID=2811111 RepID=A0A895YR09_9ACTN|nr:DUF4191 domain-containing protein [Natronosporangium hydrolyticum]QSB16448.1 DUF4191 domain-containing protein [Natronosporangium hydrolyticum]
MAKAEQEKVGFFGRLKQIGMVFKFTAKQDKWFVPWAAAAVLLPMSLVVLALLAGLGWLWLPVGLMTSLLALLIVLNVRSSKVFMKAAEQQPGAAASIVERMRGDWRVTPAISSTTQMDMIHLVLSRRGVILLAEGDRQRLKPMLGQEKRRLSKVIGSAPLHDFILGHGENEIPLGKLRIKLMQLPKSMSGRDVNSLDKRLKALSARPRMPKGAIPKEMVPRNIRPPKGATRGR